MLSLLYQDPLLFFVWLLAIAYGITIHEFAHAWIALWQGDSTAKDLGRVTLNPLAHIDMVGLLMLVMVGFGWGKPTPVDPYNLKHGKTSDNLVSFAGIFFNLVSFTVFLLILKLLITFTNLGPDNLLVTFLTFLMLVNLSLAIFNLLPIPPLDGSHILMNILPNRFNNVKMFLLQNGPWLLLALLIADNFLNLNIFSSLFSFIFQFVFRFV